MPDTMTLTPEERAMMMMFLLGGAAHTTTDRFKAFQFCDSPGLIEAAKLSMQQFGELQSPESWGAYLHHARAILAACRAEAAEPLTPAEEAEQASIRG